MLNTLLRLMKGFLSLAVAIIFFEIIYEVFSRYIMKQAVPWGAEVTQTLLVWVTFIGTASAFNKGHHMAIDFLVKSIPSPSVRKVVENFANLVIFAFLAAGAWSGFAVVSRTWSDRTVALQIPGGVIYLAFPVSMILMMLIAALKYFEGRKKI